MDKASRFRYFHFTVIFAVIITLLSITMFPQGAAEVKASGTLQPLDNFFMVDSGADQGKKVTVFDGSIEKYNGYYYLLGTGSRGNVYRSEDMIHWETRYEMISDDPETLPDYADDIYARYGAGVLYYHNGVMFYGFNGTNLIHGDPITMDATPDFDHSFWDEKFDDGIDPQFYVAHNGDLLYLRKVNPNEPDPNTGASKPGRAGAWLWNVKSFFNEKDHPDRSEAKELIHTEAGHWANIDKFNFEGPEMYYHNGQYYLLYMGNNMDPRTGLYDTGGSQADHYDLFTNDSKYPGKLIARNIEQMILDYDVILPTSEHGAQNYKYKFAQPNGSWNAINYNDTNWSSGEGGFGYPLEARDVRIPSIYNDGTTNTSQIWGSSDGHENIWVRRSFNLDSVPQTAVIRHRVEGYGKIYINGQEIVDHNGLQRGYKMVEVPAGILQEGDNVIAAEVSRSGGNTLPFYHLDLGLYDTNGVSVEADIVGPTQPNVIKGPNGFETWVTYKALWDGNNGQGKDRAYFWDDEMVVDGPTSINTSGLRFEPGSPTFHDRFDSTDSWNNYTTQPSDVSIQNGNIFFNTPTEFRQILLSDYEPENFFMEANIKYEDDDFGHLGRAGLTVWLEDNDNYVRVFIDRDDHKLIVPHRINGNLNVVSYDLPSSFQFLHSDGRASGFNEQYHTLKIYKNGSKLFVELDHYKLNDDQPVLELDEMSSPGKVGLACDKSKCRMDNVTVSVGWSGYSNYINDWDGAWTVTGEGIQSPSSGRHLTVKGDPVLEHEFSAHIDTGTLPSTGRTGLILSYVDENNYVIGFTDYANKQFKIRQYVDGQGSLVASADTARDTINGHYNYEGDGQTEYQYDIRGTAEISQAQMLWFYGEYDYVNKFYKLPNTGSSNFGFDSWDNSTSSWDNLDYQYEWKGRGDYHAADFNSNPVTDKLQLRVPSEINRPFAFALREEISSQNFYKTTRTDGRIYLWVNNELIFDIADPFNSQPSQVGLFVNDIESTYNSVTSFELR